MSNKQLHPIEALLVLGVLGFLYMAIRPPSMRLRTEVGERINVSKAQALLPAAELERARRSPQELLVNFTIPRMEITAGGPKGNGVDTDSKAPSPAPWLHALGSVIDDSGVRWQYFKDARSNRLVKVRLDGKEEANVALISIENDRFILKLNGELWAVERSRKR